MNALLLAFLIADDRDSFSAKPAPPNVMWLIDNSGSMMNLPCSEFPEGACFEGSDRTLETKTIKSKTVKLCKSKFIDSLGYNPATTYPYPDEDFTKGASELYPTGTIYRSNDWDTTSTSAASFCGNFACAQKQRCLYSLANYGYFFEESGCVGSGDPSNTCSSAGTNNLDYAPRVTGNFLRLYPPKYVVARAVFKSIMGDADEDAALARQRMALMFYNTNNNGGDLQRRMNPPCNQLCFDDTCKSNFANNRASMVNTINKMKFETNTPLGETLDDIACYFSAGNWPAGCSADTADGGSNTAPVCLACQANFALLLTDGLPTSDTNADMSKADGKTDPEGYILPEVARFAAQTDLDPVAAGTQSIVTYAVSFGATDKADPTKCAGVLERAAAAGKGRCLAARDGAQLKAALLTIIAEIDQRSRAFTAPAVQATRAQGENNANLAVFKPYSAGPLWEGHLFSFKLFDELIENAQFSGGTSANGEVFVIDADNKKVTFDAEGDLISRPFWDAGLCLAGDLSGPLGALSPEDPFDLPVSSCSRVADEAASNGRKIYTKVDPTTGTGGSTPDSFTVGNVAAIKTPMGLATEAAKKVIAFFRGFDILDVLGRGTVLPYVDRNLSTFGQKRGWWKLGDIYHSMPSIVPAPQEYLQATYTASSKSSYDAFFESKRGRKRLIVAGANDGMLHAFDAGTATNTTAPLLYSQGTGAELWAFVPPQHLPRMATQVSCANDTTTPCTVNKEYQYYVDGSALIRDAYTGKGSTAATLSGATSPNLANPSNAAQWKSILVVGDRDGGTRFTALDVSDTENPKFLWQFPTTIGTGATQRGEAAGLTWSDVFPVPAPIIPVKFDADGSLTTTTDQYLRWVVLLNGGFSRNQTAGRGVYMLDANDGTLLWKYEYSTVDTEHQAMRYSFAAPVAGVAWPLTESSVTVGIAVDTGGQVWRFDFSQPGIMSSGMAQWTGQRIFQTAAYPANPNSDLTLSLDEYPYRPMFHVVSAASSRDYKDLWVYIGTGDRDLLSNPTLAHSSGVGLASTIPNAVCGRSPYDGVAYVNRMYALQISRGRRVSTAPNTEADLTALNDTASGDVIRLYDPKLTTKYGWYLRLRPAEKVNNPSDVFSKTLYFTSYTPTGSCATTNASDVQSCEAPSGIGRLYALDFETGRPALDFNTGSGTDFGTIAGITTNSADTSKSLGGGIPTASAVSVGIGNGRQSAALLFATSTDPTPQAQRANAPTSLVKRVLSTLVPKQLHDLLPSYGSSH